MPQKSWTGFLRLSLVSCPVYLSLATEENELTEKEQKALQAIKPNVIDLDHFVARGEVDPLYLNSSYYVYPDGELATETVPRRSRRRWRRRGWSGSAA